jgi:hypothetical protein
MIGIFAGLSGRSTGVQELQEFRRGTKEVHKQNE